MNSNPPTHNIEIQKRNVLNFLWLNAEFFHDLKQMSLDYDHNPFSMLYKNLGFAKNEPFFIDFKLALTELASEKLNNMDKMDSFLSSYPQLINVFGYFIKQNPPTLLNNYLQKWYDKYTGSDPTIEAKRAKRLDRFFFIQTQKWKVSTAHQIFTANLEFFQACIVVDNTDYTASAAFMAWVQNDKERARAITEFSGEVRNFLCCCPATSTYKLKVFLEAVECLNTQPEQMFTFLTANEEFAEIICHLSFDGNAMMKYISDWYAEHPIEKSKKEFRNMEKPSLVRTHSNHFQPKRPAPDNGNSDVVKHNSLKNF